MRIIILVIMSMLSSLANAGYYVSGPIKASDCNNYLFFSTCQTITVTEFRAGGKSYEMPKYFKNVSSYRSGTCTVETKSTKYGLVSMGYNLVSAPELWGSNQKGDFSKIDTDLISFKCREQ